MTVVPERITSKGISFWWIRAIEQATGCRLRKRKWRNKVLPSRHFGVPLSRSEDDQWIENSRIGRCVSSNPLLCYKQKRVLTRSRERSGRQTRAQFFFHT